jgi:hypothetical protein
MKGLLQVLLGVKLLAREQKLSGKPARSQRELTVVQLIYREISTALWAVAVAFAFYFVAVILPKLPELRNRAEVLRIQEINAENEHYCQKLYMGLGTPMHDECILAFQQLRNDIEKRISDDHEL